MATKKDTRQVARTIASDCVGARIRMLNRKITRIYDEMIRPYGLKFSQMNILTIISLHEPISPADVGRALEIEKSTLSRNLAIMQSNGWVIILPGEGNSQLLRTTGPGRRLLEEAASGWREAQARVGRMLGSGTTTSIRQAVDRLIAGGS